MERPILFSGPMVQAILDDKKSMTRRVIKGNPTRPYWCGIGHGWDDGHGYEIKCPYGKVGGILWVRETFSLDGKWGYSVFGDLDFEPNGKYFYKADYSGEIKTQWKPSIFMPREACRIRLKITDIRVERVRDITEEDAKDEGVKDPYEYQSSEYYEQPHIRGLEINQSAFAGLWDSINLKRGYSWKKNPWVWVVLFERVST